MHVEVRDFVAGEVFAINNYKPRIATAGSVLAGAMGGYLAFYGMLVPASYVVGTSSVSPDIRNIKGKLIIPADMKNNEYFIRGYKDRARKKEIRNTIWGGLAGLSAMIIIKSINSSNK
jgi:hypothetical protein